MFRQDSSCPGVLWIPPCSLKLRIRGCHPLRPAFPKPFSCLIQSIMRSKPRSARATVWAPPVSLAATPGIDVSFSSSGYLDVSVHRVPFRTLWIGARIHGSSPCGFPHSEICGSADMCSSPQLIAAYHVFHRLLVPRHPPCALSAWPVGSLPCYKYLIVIVFDTLFSQQISVYIASFISWSNCSGLFYSRMS